MLCLVEWIAIVLFSVHLKKWHNLNRSKINRNEKNENVERKKKKRQKYGNGQAYHNHASQWHIERIERWWHVSHKMLTVHIFHKCCKFVVYTVRTKVYISRFEVNRFVWWHVFCGSFRMATRSIIILMTQPLDHSKEY